MSGGWHPDPTGRFGQRWYDGHRWTDHVVAANGTSIEDLLPDVERPHAPPLAATVPPPFGSPPPFLAAAGNQWDRAPTPDARPIGGVEGRLGPGATLYIALLGLVLVALSLFGVPWITDGDGVSFLDISEAVRDSSGGGEAVVRAYAGFGGFVLFGLSLVGAVLAGIPVPRSAAAARGWRIGLSTWCGIAAVLHTVTVVRTFRGPATPEIGAWLGTVGYLVVIVALVVGHYRRR